FLELIDLSKREGVLHRDRHLFGHFAKQLRILPRERVLAQARDAQNSQRPIVRDQRNNATGLDARVDEPPSQLILTASGVTKHGLPSGEGDSTRVIVEWNDLAFY